MTKEILKTTHIITGKDTIGSEYTIRCGKIQMEVCGWGGWAWTLDGEFSGACDYSGPVHIDTENLGTE